MRAEDRNITVTNRSRQESSRDLLLSTIGETPLIPPRRLDSALPAAIWAKLEMRNPAASVNDRVAMAMVAAAERSGKLRPGGTIVEATGGNTGIGLAMVAAVRGYRLVLTMPETMSTERVAILRQMGARVELTEGILMTDARDLCKTPRAATTRRHHPRPILQRGESRGAPSDHRSGDLAGHGRIGLMHSSVPSERAARSPASERPSGGTTQMC